MTDGTAPGNGLEARAALEAVFAATTATDRPIRRELPEAVEFNQSLIDEFRASGGRVEGFFADLVLLVTTRGRRTGKKHTVPLDYVRCGDHCIVVASNEGSERNPAWYLNLCGDAEVTVEYGQRTATTRAVDLRGDTRARMFDLVARQIACMNVYQTRTDRPLPVIALPYVAANAEQITAERVLDDEWARRWSAELEGPGPGSAVVVPGR